MIIDLSKGGMLARSIRHGRWPTFVSQQASFRRSPIGPERAAGTATTPATAAADLGETLTIARPDDWHLHVRDGDMMDAVLPHTAATFGRAIIMPNLQPPVTNVVLAQQYKQRIHSSLERAAAAACQGAAGAASRIQEAAGGLLGNFQPLMTLYLTDSTKPSDVEEAIKAGIVAFKMYPAGATTNSDSGVTNIAHVMDTLRAMSEVGMPLLVHGEVTDPSVDVFDREGTFIERVLTPLTEALPDLRIVLEHITTADAVDFVRNRANNTAATITPQHILLNRNELFKGGLRPHVYCLPVLKRERHRQAVAAAATSGEACFFLGTDSAPHPKGAKEAACGCAGIFSAPAALPLYAEAFEAAGALHHLEAFASWHGPDFYGLPRNTETVTIRKDRWQVPGSLGEGATQLVPMYAEKYLDWKVDERYLA